MDIFTRHLYFDSSYGLDKIMQDSQYYTVILHTKISETICLNNDKNWAKNEPCIVLRPGVMLLVVRTGVVLLEVIGTSISTETKKEA